MKILGIDPGMAIVGYCILDFDGKNIKLEHSGSIQTTKGHSESQRIVEIYDDMRTIVEKYQPDCASVENLFFLSPYDASQCSLGQLFPHFSLSLEPRRWLLPSQSSRMAVVFLMEMHLPKATLIS